MGLTPFGGFPFRRSARPLRVASTGLPSAGASVGGCPPTSAAGLRLSRKPSPGCPVLIPPEVRCREPSGLPMANHRCSQWSRPFLPWVSSPSGFLPPRQDRLPDLSSRGLVRAITGGDVPFQPSESCSRRAPPSPRRWPTLLGFCAASARAAFRSSRRWRRLRARDRKSTRLNSSH